MPDTIYGTEGNDFFTSTSNTVIFTLGGNDTVVALSSNNTIDGGDGVDLIEIEVGENWFVNLSLVSGGNNYADGIYFSNFENFSVILSYYSGYVYFGNGNEYLNSKFWK